MTGGMDNPVELVFTASGERIFTTTFFQHPGGGRRDGLIHAIYGGVYGKQHNVLDGHVRTSPELMPVLTHMGPAAPCGLVRMDSHSLSESYRDDLFAAQFNLHKVTRHKLVSDGSTFRTEDSDFLTAADFDFHPTDVLEDADGSLLVVDTGGWYKLCCPTSQLVKPDVLGGIYRVRLLPSRILSAAGRRLMNESRDPWGRKVDWAKLRTADLLMEIRISTPARARRAMNELVQRENSPRPANRSSNSRWRSSEGQNSSGS